MDKHKFRLTWMFFGYGLFGSAVLAIILPQIINQFTEVNNAIYGHRELTNIQLILLILGSAQPILMLVAGILSHVKKSVLNNISLVAAIISLLSLPIGTFIGAYYLWYRFIHTSKQHEPA